MSVSGVPQHRTRRRGTAAAPRAPRRAARGGGASAAPAPVVAPAARRVGNVDASLAGLLLSTSLVVLFSPAVQAGITLGSGPSRALDVVTGAVVVAQSVPLLFRRRHPLVVGTVVCGAFAAGQILHVQPTPADFGALVALYSAAAYGDDLPVWVPWVVAAAAWWGLFAALPGLDGGNVASVGVLFVLLVVVPLVLGTRLRQWRSGATQEQVSRARAERQRDEVAHRLAVEERGRIVGELHDLVARRVGAMVAEAEQEGSFGAIADAGRQALADLRHLVGARAAAPADGDGDGVAPPGLAGLAALQARMGADGLEVEVGTEGEARALPLGVDVSAYRIVEEALDNARRHGRAERARVRVVYLPDALELDVVDEGRASPTAARSATDVGRGIINMRERATLFGGTFSAAARPGGGFQVRAVLHTG